MQIAKNAVSAGIFNIDNHLHLKNQHETPSPASPALPFRSIPSCRGEGQKLHRKTRETEGLFMHAAHSRPARLFTAPCHAHHIARTAWTVFLTLPLVAASLTPARAAEVEVKMLNKGSDGQMYVFEPALVKIQPGDTVHFVAETGGHNVEALPRMIPEGAPAFKGDMSKDLKVTFDKPGIYGYRCAPHYSIGMVGIIAVGDSYPNLDAAKSAKNIGKSKQVFEKLFSELK